jgi:predicted dehydrogenase
MKAAVIGVGFSGQLHVAALRACGVEVAAVIATREETARALAEKWGIPRWGTDLTLAWAEDIDAVHICTPPKTHAALVREALNHDKHVLCEKPLCTATSEAVELLELAEDSGLVCALSFNVRYYPACQKARELIASGTFGRPLLIHGTYMQEFGAYPAPLDWRADWELAGSMRAVTEIGSHWLDLAQYVSGQKVGAISAFFGYANPDFYSEDIATLNLRFVNGALGSVLLSEVSQGRSNHLTLEITCDNGNVWWNAEESTLLHTARKGEGVHTEVFAFDGGFGGTFRELFARFYAAIASADVDSPDLPSFAEGAQVAALCSVAGESTDIDSCWVWTLGNRW